MNGTDYASLIEELDWSAVAVASLIPGRVRVKSTQLQGNEALGRRVAEGLRAVDAVTDVSVNPRTGSVLVHYDDEQLEDLSSLLDRAQALGMVPDGLDPDDLASLLDARRNGHARRDFSREVRSVVASMNESVREATGGALDLTGLVPLSLVGMGTYRLLSGAATQSLPWFNYYWFAFSIFVALKAGTDEAPASEPASTEAAAETRPAPS